MKVYYDRDADMAKVLDAKIAIAGYGSQGHAHALNLRDSGVKAITIGLREGSASAKKAEADGFPVASVKEAAALADILMVLTPDEIQPDLYKAEIRDSLRAGAAMFFAHGLSIHFRLIEPRADLDVVMVAPKGPGHTVRSEFRREGGVPCLLAVHQDATGSAKSLGLAYASALGGGRAGILETTFRDECETDLFGEQAILCGGINSLVHAAYETLVEAGYPPEMAYFECLHELKLIVDLMYEGGLSNMLYSVSNTAEYGAYVSGPKIVDEAVRARMKEILADIQSGEFARAWMRENSGDRNKKRQETFLEMRAKNEAHPIEAVGEKLRTMMPWIGKGRLVDRERN